jgi:mono/diheme cytochrome c family protein
VVEYVRQNALSSSALQRRVGESMTRLLARVLAGVFAFISGTVRNARTFHPDGRTFFATVKAETADPQLSGAGKLLEGRALMRIGMGMVKNHAPAWIRNTLPDAPSVAVRFSSADHPEAISAGDRGEQELDILFTAGGDRLWKLLLNLALGGRWYGLDRFDYLQNRYFADVPYRIPACGLDVWLRLTPEGYRRQPTARGRGNFETREQGLTDAAKRRAVLVIEAQPTGDAAASFVPFATIRFDEKIDIDQEGLHFQPVGGRGFEPHGFLTTLREKVYPASAHARPADRAQREFRDRKGFLFRLWHRADTPAPDQAGGWRSLRRLASAVGLVVFGFLLLSLAYAGWRFYPNDPITNPPDAPNDEYQQSDIDAQRFKYGSTGGEANLGFPLAMWQAAPLVCAETLKKVVGDRMAADYVTRVRNYPPRSPRGRDENRHALSREGYQAFGLIYEKERDSAQEKDIPVGTSIRRHMGFDRVFVNCAFCHTSTVRTSAQSPPALILGMPANLLNIRDFEDFLFQCTSGPQFSRENLIPEIEAMNGRVGFLDRLLLYPVAIWFVRDRVGFLSSRLGFFAKQPEWGPGRVDTFSNAKGIFNWPWQKLPNWHTDKRVEFDQVGTVEFPSIWRQQERKTRSADGCPMELHWDGNNDAVEERDLSAAFGTGALPTNIDHKNLERIEEWLLKRSEPPKFADYFPAAFDPALADAGRTIYQQRCADCHGASGEDFTGKYVGKVTPIDEIGTDRYRLDNYTEGLAATQAMLYAGEKKRTPAARQDLPPHCTPAPHGDAQENSYRFKRFHKTHGYANTPLDGIWLRAPYLHNGSVPTLEDLLKPVRLRPEVFYRGNDEYDPVAMGFKSKSETAPDGRAYFKYDTKEPGNSNKGHVYGTDLSEADKRPLIEFLKTF